MSKKNQRHPRVLRERIHMFPGLRPVSEKVSEKVNLKGDLMDIS